MDKAFFNTLLGSVELIGSASGLRSVRILSENVPESEYIAESLQSARQQIKEYFEQKRTMFELQLDWSGAPPFFIRVWEALINIPYGKTTTYADLAHLLNNPKSVRAVGMANAKNPIPIIVPCHRVIGKNGNLTGFYYGLSMKKALLELENPNFLQKKVQLMLF